MSIELSARTQPVTHSVHRNQEPSIVEVPSDPSVEHIPSDQSTEKIPTQPAKEKSSARMKSGKDIIPSRMAGTVKRSYERRKDEKKLKKVTADKRGLFVLFYIYVDSCSYLDSRYKKHP